MEAGNSSDRIAKQLANKAKYLNQKSEDYVKGKVGEKLTALELKKLNQDNFYFLHDRKSRTGGNIDHIAFTKSGVIVIDSKNWSGPLNIKGKNLFNNGKNVEESINTILEVIEKIKITLKTDRVYPMFVFPDDVNIKTFNGLYKGVKFVSLSNLNTTLLGLKNANLDVGFMKQCFDIISEEYQNANDKIIYKTEPVPANQLVEGTPEIFEGLSIEERYVFIYATFWKKNTVERLYIKTDKDSNDYYDIKAKKLVHKKKNSYLESIAKAVLGESVELTNFVNLNWKNKLLYKIGSKFVVDQDSIFNKAAGYVVAVKRKGTQKITIYQYCFDGSKIELGFVYLPTGEITVSDPKREGLLNHSWHIISSFL